MGNSRRNGSGTCRKSSSTSKVKKISQQRLSIKSGVSLGSIKRFEGTGQISLLSLTKIAVAFEYHDEWLKNGFSICPFSLPLKKQVFIPEKNYFGGLFGVFADSLPDAWGILVTGRIRGTNSNNMSTKSPMKNVIILAKVL